MAREDRSALLHLHSLWLLSAGQWNILIPGVMLINKMPPEFIFLKMQFHYIVLVHDGLEFKKKKVPISQAVDQLQYKLAAGYIAGF